MPKPLRKFLLRNCHKDIGECISDPNQFVREFEEVRRQLAA